MIAASAVIIAMTGVSIGTGMIGMQWMGSTHRRASFPYTIARHTVFVLCNELFIPLEPSPRFSCAAIIAYRPPYGKGRRGGDLAGK